jgi:hypothetical protein
LTKGTIPERRSYLRAYLTEARAGLIRDLGPDEDDLTTAQKILIDRVITKLGVLRLIEEHCQDSGIFNQGELVSSLGQNYIAFDNSIRLSLQALGLDRRQKKEILELSDYIAMKDREKARSGQGKAGQERTEGKNPPDQGEGEIVQPARSWREVSEVDNPGKPDDDETGDIGDVDGSGGEEPGGVDSEENGEGEK